jgi:L-asparaginase II
MSSFVPLVELTRGGIPECSHFGAVAVVDARGRVTASAGDADWVGFTRSTLKPFQALPFMQAGGADRFGFSTGQIALLCASHGGEAMHVAQVDSMLEKAGVGYRRLQCGCHVPAYVELGVGPAPAHYDERHNNCSGKHAGFLAMCVQQGWSLDDYLAAGHPLQKAVRHEVAAVTGLTEDALKIGIDGCSAPNYAMPLSRLARAYARLASATPQDEQGVSLTRLADAMTAHPELVSGTGRNDLAFMKAGRGDWVSKGGADGVQAVGSRSRGVAFAVKVADGNRTAVVAAAVAVMEQLGWLDDAQRQALQPWREEAIVNLRGIRVGERRAVFRLRS